MWRFALLGLLVGTSAGCNQIFGLGEASSVADSGGSADGSDGGSDGGSAGCTMATCTVATSPFCDPTSHACRACIVDSDCADGGACVPGDFLDTTIAGSCIAATDVAFAAASGSGNDCSALAPCTLASAIAKAVPFVRVVDSLTSPGGLDLLQSVTILGGDGVTVTGDIMTDMVTVEAGTVSIYDVTLTRPGGVKAGIGISVAGGTTLKLDRSRVTGNFGIGVDFNGDQLVMTRAQVDSNRGGGISINQGSFDITNTFVVQNGTNMGSSPNPPPSNFGGLFVQNATSTSRFEYNTVADNTDKANAGFAPGLACTFTAPAITLANNIYATNAEGSGPGVVVNTSSVTPVPPAPPACTFATTIETSTGSDSDALFVDRAVTMNYHLKPNTNAQDKAMPLGPAITDDFDGNTRPLFNAPDIGADECLTPKM